MPLAVVGNESTGVIARRSPGRRRCSRCWKGSSMACATLHAHDGVDLAEVASRIAARLGRNSIEVEGVLINPSTAPLGVRRLLWPSRGLVQWNLRTINWSLQPGIARPRLLECERPSTTVAPDEDARCC